MGTVIVLVVLVVIVEAATRIGGINAEILFM